MEIKPSELLAKIGEIHPELEGSGVQVTCYFEEKSGAWVVGLPYGEHSLETRLETADVEDCLAGRQCVHLGAQVGRFVQNYCLRDDICAT